MSADAATAASLAETRSKRRSATLSSYSVRHHSSVSTILVDFMPGHSAGRGAAHAAGGPRSTTSWSSALGCRQGRPQLGRRNEASSHWSAAARSKNGSEGTASSSSSRKAAGASADATSGGARNGCFGRASVELGRSPRIASRRGALSGGRSLSANGSADACRNSAGSRNGGRPSTDAAISVASPSTRKM
jgi:hypothetical protein